MDQQSNLKAAILNDSLRQDARQTENNLLAKVKKEKEKQTNTFLAYFIKIKQM